MANITETLEKAAETLRRSEIAEPRREAATLLAFALDKDKIYLIAHSEYELLAAEETYFQALLQRRASREPFQQIAGRQEFFGLDFIVTKDVLIPRPETELIVEHAINILRELESPRFCEVGTGSGCISVSILHELKNASAIGLEISEKALEITSRNAEIHRVAERLDLKISDVFAALTQEKFDVIVSNPPYIAREEIDELQPEVRDYEPHVALTDENDGFSIIEQLIEEAPRFLESDGFLLIEIGFNQAAHVIEMFDAKIWRAVEILPDLQNIPRMVRAQIYSAPGDVAAR